MPIGFVRATINGIIELRLKTSAKAPNKVKTIKSPYCLLRFFSICANNKAKTLSVEPLLDYVNTCKIPKFPFSGDYLMKHGYETGQALGKKLKSLEEKWVENNFVIEKNVVEKSLGKVDKN